MLDLGGGDPDTDEDHNPGGDDIYNGGSFRELWDEPHPDIEMTPPLARTPVDVGGAGSDDSDTPGQDSSYLYRIARSHVTSIPFSCF